MWRRSDNLPLAELLVAVHAASGAEERTRVALASSGAKRLGRLSELVESEVLSGRVEKHEDGTPRDIVVTGLGTAGRALLAEARPDLRRELGVTLPPSTHSNTYNISGVNNSAIAVGESAAINSASGGAVRGDEDANVKELAEKLLDAIKTLPFPLRGSEQDFLRAELNEIVDECASEFPDKQAIEKSLSNVKPLLLMLVQSVVDPVAKSLVEQLMSVC